MSHCSLLYLRRPVADKGWPAEEVCGGNSWRKLHSQYNGQVYPRSPGWGRWCQQGRRLFLPRDHVGWASPLAGPLPAGPSFATGRCPIHLVLRLKWPPSLLAPPSPPGTTYPWGRPSCCTAAMAHGHGPASTALFTTADCLSWPPLFYCKCPPPSASWVSSWGGGFRGNPQVVGRWWVSASWISWITRQWLPLLKCHQTLGRLLPYSWPSCILPLNFTGTAHKDAPNSLVMGNGPSSSAVFVAFCWSRKQWV